MPLFEMQGGRRDEALGSEHLSRCVIPLDKSFHHHLRRALRGAERGAVLLRPQCHSIKLETGVAIQNIKADK